MLRTLTYNDIHSLTLNIISQTELAGFVPDIVAGFCRGGMLPAVIVSQYFNCKFLPIELSLRDSSTSHNNYTSSVMRINDDLRAGKKILVIDDICDKGSTFIHLFDHLSIVNPANINGHNLQTAALQQRYTAAYTPTYIAEHINNDDWQIFPWEVSNGKNE